MKTGRPTAMTKWWATLRPDQREKVRREIRAQLKEPLEKEISVEDMQKIVDANEKLVKELKDGNK